MQGGGTHALKNTPGFVFQGSCISSADSKLKSCRGTTLTATVSWVAVVTAGNMKSGASGKG